MLPKISIIFKKTSNESCSKLNFVPKSLRGVKDRFCDVSMIDQSKSNFRKSQKIDFLRPNLIDHRKID